jgi:hypothetical protein
LGPAKSPTRKGDGGALGGGDGGSRIFNLSFSDSGIFLVSHLWLNQMRYNIES